MNLPRFLRIPLLALGGLMVVASGAAFNHVEGQTNDQGTSPAPPARGQGHAVTPASDAERYVVSEAQKGYEADLDHKFPSDKFSKDKRTLRGAFIAQLLTNRDPRIQGVFISHAVITGSVDLAGEAVPYYVTFRECTFDDAEFHDSHFAKGLDLSGSDFTGEINFGRVTIAQNFTATGCEFSWANFGRIRVDGDFDLTGSSFSGQEISFESARVGGSFTADECQFNALHVTFKDMGVDGGFSAKRCLFHSDTEYKGPVFTRFEYQVSFSGGHFADVFLNESSFEGVSTIDFTRMQANSISLDGLNFKTSSAIDLGGMTFKVMSPVDPNQLGFMLARYDAQFYSDLETSFRSHGHPAEADSIYVLKRRAERRQGCGNFWRQCDRGAFAWSLFQDGLAGYGKRLENLLYWSLGFLIVGTIVFWKKDGMRLKDEKAAAHTPTYHAFWYSLDLFLPIIKLGETDMWTPKENRRWANLYRRVHIIIGSLFVPIGLAAWTGIIK